MASIKTNDLNLELMGEGIKHHLGVMKYMKHSVVTNDKEKLYIITLHLGSEKLQREIDVKIFCNDSADQEAKLAKLENAKYFETIIEFNELGVNVRGNVRGYNGSHYAELTSTFTTMDFNMKPTRIQDKVNGKN